MKPNNPAAMQQRIAQLERELREYIRAEDVMVAAGIVTKEKIEQAHEIVRGLDHA